MTAHPHLKTLRKIIHRWYVENARDLPWRNTHDPYVIWLSEIILQQTRVNQGMPYFLKFMARYPDIFALAGASLDEIKKMWEGLGYYRRAENMHKTARIIAGQKNGKFPRSYEELLQLPGIGPYTAAAIASFAFDQPVAVADGNVHRVLARLFHIREPVNSSRGIKLFQQAADLFLDRSRPALHNQSLMEFGALQCLPKNPDCTKCPARNYCMAFASGKPEKLPVKKAKKPSRKRYFHYLVSVTSQGISARKRTADDIWRGLYEFPSVESEKELTQKEILQTFEKKFRIKPHQVQFITSVKHKLTHQDLYLHFWLTTTKLSDVQYFDSESIRAMAFPVVMRRILEDFVNIPNFET